MEHPSDPYSITAFICANCARPGRAALSGKRIPSEIPDFHWPDCVQQILIPCAGRLQPEHVLKAFENGTSIVSVIACEEDNCCYVEGSTRCSRRVEYVRSILREIGLGEERLLLFHLPGSAARDLGLAEDRSIASIVPVSLDEQVAGICARMMQVFQHHPHSPFLAPVPENRNGNLAQGGRDSMDIFHEE